MALVTFWKKSTFAAISRSFRIRIHFPNPVLWRRIRPFVPIVGNERKTNFPLQNVLSDFFSFKLFFNFASRKPCTSDIWGYNKNYSILYKAFLASLYISTNKSKHCTNIKHIHFMNQKPFRMFQKLQRINSMPSRITMIKFKYSIF